VTGFVAVNLRTASRLGYEPVPFVRFPMVRPLPSNWPSSWPNNRPTNRPAPSRLRSPCLALVATLGAALSTGCGDTGLAQSWQLDRLRVLGVQAEPAEPRPGDVVRFTSLVYVPKGTSLAGTVWFACLPSGSDEFGCEVDTSVLEALQGDLSDLTPEEQAELYQQAVEAGFVGFEPLLPPIWIAPDDALDGLTEAEQEEGLSAIINITALPEGEDVDETDLELAYKRVPVSLATTPNHNPAIDSLDVELGGALVASHAAPFVAKRGETYTLRPTLAVDSLETYTFINNEGETEEREEQPYFTWYTEGGSFDQDFSLYPHVDVDWTAPDKPFSGVIVTVVRDRRGGMAWASLHAQVE
jgi:hypothetical protein